MINIRILFYYLNRYQKYSGFKQGMHISSFPVSSTQDRLKSFLFVKATLKIYCSEATFLFIFDFDFIFKFHFVNINKNQQLHFSVIIPIFIFFKSLMTKKFIEF